MPGPHRVRRHAPNGRGGPARDAGRVTSPLVPSRPPVPRPRADDPIEQIVRGEHAEPHAVLGAHPSGTGWVVRVWRPGAERVTVLPADAAPVPAAQVHPAGVFAAELPASDQAPEYRVEVAYPGDSTFVLDDPYRFLPTLGDLDLHLIGEGSHRRLWEVLGAHVRVHQGVEGTSFTVWAPSARFVRVVGDFNGWDGRLGPMRIMGSSGVWELFVPGVGPGDHYKFELLSGDRHLLLKADPMARAAEEPPGTASVVARSSYRWSDDAWVAERERTDQLHRPLSIYEVHLGSWRRDAEGRSLGYREIGELLGDYVADLGFTHVELLPVMEHPYGPSWGYQVTGYYAPTARQGSPDDLRAMIDALHQRGIGVIVDWVPAHFPRDDWALARFDGSALYEHLDPRQGEHPDWGTLVFNYGRNEVRNFLVANALYWIDEFHVDGLRVDAVASMVYLDYSREEGEWVPNRYGGNENLEAVGFIHELNTVVHAEHPGVLTIAEESTAWPAVSRPVHLGGLGFTHKWNMGWMNDTLAYFNKEPIHRKYHHHQLTFGLLYAFTENFVLPLSHDEVVHGKGSLLSKMPGDRWQQIANLKALLAWTWAHPGKQLLFMGGEVGQEWEWAHDGSVEWHLLQYRDHQGVQDLVRALNRILRDEPALYQHDFDWSGFRWIDANDSDGSVYSFLRFSTGEERALACLANLTPVPRPAYRVGLPKAGRWEVVLDTDSSYFAGSDYAKVAGYDTEPVPWHGLDQSIEAALPPLAVVWLRWVG
ncbi:MAG: 1,4-alpha-glucan branching protein GlgB [Acidimicrobiales bacterium]|nr:1,4-alpha-glucan branching protein GlgB [Acidimicrobiales bacterium]